MIGITGASGQLGKLIIEHLISKGVDPQSIVAIARSTDKLEDFANQGVVVRFGDYTKPDSLLDAFQGLNKLLLISSSEVGQRFQQHKNVIDALKDSSIEHLVYTSILHADTSPLDLAQEHVETEKLINGLNITKTILRNGWYTENYTMSIPTILEYSAVVGCAQEGRISSATRSDYALAAASVLIEKGHENKVYELAGDTSYSLQELAESISRIYEKDIVFNNLTENEFKNVLMQAGLPEGFAELLANSESGAAKGGLFDESKTLSRIINQPTESLSETIEKLKA